MIPLSSAWNSHDNISFNYSFIVTIIRLPFNPSLLLKPPHTCKAEKWHMGLHRNSSDFLPSHTGRSRGTNGFYLKAEGTRTAWREAVGWQWMGEGTLMSGTGRNVRGRSWPNSLHPIPRLLPSSHWQAGRLRAKISSHFLTEGQGDTVLRMNGHVMLSML